MKIKKIDHIGIAVKDVNKALEFFTSILGSENFKIKELDEMKLRIAEINVSDITIELLEPMTGEKVVSKFLQKRGGGIHHICFEVDDIEKATSYLSTKGFKPVYEHPKKVPPDRFVNFLEPKDTFGVLVEFNEPLKKS